MTVGARSRQLCVIIQRGQLHLRGESVRRIWAMILPPFREARKNFLNWVQNIKSETTQMYKNYSLCAAALHGAILDVSGRPRCWIESGHATKTNSLTPTTTVWSARFCRHCKLAFPAIRMKLTSEHAQSFGADGSCIYAPATLQCS